MTIKKRPGFKQHGKNIRDGEAMTIAVFCKRNAISEGLYFALKRNGKGPREMELGKRIIITPEAERDWRREREAETAARRDRAVTSRGDPPGIHSGDRTVIQKNNKI